MNKTDFSVRLSGASSTLTFVSSLTNCAQPNSAFEVHTHYSEFEIYYFIEGDLYFSFEGKRYAISAGTMLVIAPGTLHRPIIKAPCRYHRKRILFNKEVFLKLNTAALSIYAMLCQKKLILISSEHVHEMCLSPLIDEIENSLSQNTHYENFCALISLFSLLIKIEKVSQKSDNKFIYVSNKKADEIIQYIEGSLTEDLSYKSISKRFYISEKSLYKLFKKETGFTLSNYINDRRIIKAKSVLDDGGTATEAAMQAGFENYSVFYRSFMRKLGISPAEYMKNSTKGIK